MFRRIALICCLVGVGVVAGLSGVVAADEVVFTEDFESYRSQAQMLRNWVPYFGKQPLELVSFEGRGTVASTGNGERIGVYKLPQDLTEGIVELEFYDPTGPEEIVVTGVAGLYLKETDKMMYIGISATWWGTENYKCYVTRDGAHTDPAIAGKWNGTEVMRTKGWHKMRFEVRDGKTSVYIDDVKIFETASVGTVQGIGIGGLWPTSQPVYFDNIVIKKL